MSEKKLSTKRYRKKPYEAKCRLGNPASISMAAIVEAITELQDAIEQGGFRESMFIDTSNTTPSLADLAEVERTTRSHMMSNFDDVKKKIEGLQQKVESLDKLFEMREKNDTAKLAELWATDDELKAHIEKVIERKLNARLSEFSLPS